MSNTNPTTIRLTKNDKSAIKKLLKRHTFLRGTTAAISYALSVATAPTTTGTGSVTALTPETETKA